MKVLGPTEKIKLRPDNTLLKPVKEGDKNKPPDKVPSAPLAYRMVKRLNDRAIRRFYKKLDKDPDIPARVAAEQKEAAEAGGDKHRARLEQRRSQIEG